jgi:predicted acylesterase/phospholipase RssA
MNDVTHALILSGGGAEGAYEIGVMRALFNGLSAATDYRSLDAEVFTGTSVGALNAAFMTSQPGVPSASTVLDLERIWIEVISEGPDSCGNGIYRLRGDPLRYFEPECYAPNPAGQFVTAADDAVFFARYLFTRGYNFVTSSAGLPERTLQFFDMSAFISTEPLRQNIKRLFRFDNIRGSDKLLRVAATDWNTGVGRVFENADMTDELGPLILQASSAIPGIFPPVIVGGDTYVDGGVVMNTPLQVAIKSGATTLHVIYLDPDVGTIPVRRLQDTIDTMMKMFTIMRASIANEDIDHALEINEGLKLIEQAADGETLPDSQLRHFIRFAGWLKRQSGRNAPYEKLTIHRYRPRGELAGSLGMLNFDRDVITRSIERGFSDAVNHDCGHNKCVLPD